MIRKPLNWHGGKHYIAKYIIQLIPSDTVTYVEPYLGGGSVLLQKPQSGHNEIVNDIDGHLINFWRHLSDKKLFDELYNKLKLTPISQELWNFSKSDTSDAYNFMIWIRQSRQALGKDFATLSHSRTRGGMNETASSWISMIDGLPEVYERLRGVVILNQDAIKVINRFDKGEHVLFYLDPPYELTTRTAKKCYTHEMDRQKHIELLKRLSDFKSRFILSGYRCKLYDKYCTKNNWNLKEIEIDNKSGGGKTKQKRVECLWTNF